MNIFLGGDKEGNYVEYPMIVLIWSYGVFVFWWRNNHDCRIIDWGFNWDIRWIQIWIIKRTDMGSLVSTIIYDILI